MEDIDSAFVRFFGWDDEETINEVLAQSDWVNDLYERCKRHIGDGYQILLKNEHVCLEWHIYAVNRV